MRGGRRGVVMVGLGLCLMSALSCAGPDEVMFTGEEERMVCLPAPVHEGDVSLEEALSERRSVRSYTEEPLTMVELGQLLWAAQGITDPAGLRTAPSAGGTYPLEIYAVAGNVTGLAPGVYRYVPDGHRLAVMMEGDVQADLADAALGQEWVEEGAVVFVLTAVYGRTTNRYGDRGVRYVHLEAGHAAQNLCLQATALGLGSVTVGAFNDKKVGDVLGLPEDEQPLYVIPAGRR